MPTDGKIVAACSNQGHLFAAYFDVTKEVPGEVILKEKFVGKSFADVVVTQKALIAATFNCEFYFYELYQDEKKGTYKFIEVR